VEELSVIKVSREFIEAFEHADQMYWDMFGSLATAAAEKIDAEIKLPPPDPKLDAYYPGCRPKKKDRK
jgi:hypothetical protein